jgi:excinuclease ABC subunit A
VNEVDISKIIPDPGLSIKKGGIQPLGPYKNSLIFWQLEAIAAKYRFTLNTPVRDIPEDGLNVILYGSEETFKLENTPIGLSTNYFLSFEGIVNYVAGQQNGNDAENEKWADQFIRKVICPDCNGARLRKESLHFRIHDCSIADLASMEIAALNDWFSGVDAYLTERQRKIGTEIIKEQKTRIRFLLDVGLEYLTPNRSSKPGGRCRQRIRLLHRSQLVNVLYILDEPSIGLHQRDNRRLIAALKDLRDAGNSVIVEHTAK